MLLQGANIDIAWHTTPDAHEQPHQNIWQQTTSCKVAIYIMYTKHIVPGQNGFTLKYHG